MRFALILALCATAWGQQPNEAMCQYTPVPKAVYALSPPCKSAKDAFCNGGYCSAVVVDNATTPTVKWFRGLRLSGGITQAEIWAQMAGTQYVFVDINAAIHWTEQGRDALCYSGVMRNQSSGRVGGVGQ
ncbi:MAG TPA: hypothetical protein VE779_11450 [Candidatus Angelobacter sp.]|nr:hypothetical protein [Candidatus Angelobacter sp.]